MLLAICFNSPHISISIWFLRMALRTPPRPPPLPLPPPLQAPSPLLDVVTVSAPTPPQPPILTIPCFESVGCRLASASPLSPTASLVTSLVRSSLPFVGSTAPCYAHRRRSVGVASRSLGWHPSWVASGALPGCQPPDLATPTPGVDGSGLSVAGFSWQVAPRREHRHQLLRRF
jgi:hypothetical protein